jgi:hypothetical protein
MPPTLGSSKLLTIVEASAMLAPHLTPVNATNWLADMRRREAYYKKRGAGPPRCVKHNGVWHYPVEAIQRVIDELKAAKEAHLPKT